MLKIYKYFVVAIIIGITFSVISCKGKKKNGEISDHQKDELQLNLADKMNPLRLQASFPNLGLKYICTKDKSQNIAVFSIDLRKSSLEDAIIYLDKEVGVESASRTNGCEI